MRHLQNLVASIRKPLQGLVNFLTHFLRDYQLALNREGLTHRPIIVQLNCRRLKSLFVFPPCSKEARFPNVSGISYDLLLCASTRTWCCLSSIHVPYLTIAVPSSHRPPNEEYGR
jgi:hypothetical protein